MIIQHGMCFKTAVHTSSAKRKATSTAQVSSDGFQRLPDFPATTSALIVVLLTI